MGHPVVKVVCPEREAGTLIGSARLRPVCTNLYGHAQGQRRERMSEPTGIADPQRVRHNRTEPDRHYRG